MDRSITLAEIRIFLALANHLHFGRTAEEVGVTQSRVSQVVRRLEAHVGGALFERSTRRVRLTVLGEQLHGTIGPAHGELQRVLHDVRQAAIGVGPRLALGLISQSAAGGPYLDAICRAFRCAHPSCTLRLVEVPLTDALGPLRRGEVDVMCLAVPVVADDILEGPLLLDEPRVLLVAENHALTRRTRVCWEDLGDHVVADVEGLAPEVSAAVLPTTTSRGRPIARGERVHNMSELLAAVAAGTVVHPTAASTPSFRRRPGTVALPLHDAPRARAALVLPTARRTPAAEAFVLAAEHVLERTPLAPAPP